MEGPQGNRIWILKTRKVRFASKPAGDGSGRGCPAATFQLPLGVLIITDLGEL